ncbi:MAG: hypothetical protein C0402_05245 [Thermodesulfovibrio sp.]|nr:hypothetical protein [Thermodesulfovibrio sp.]
MSERASFLKDVYAGHNRSSRVSRLSIRRRGFIEIADDGYIVHVKVRPSLHGEGIDDRLIQMARRLYGNNLHSDAFSEEDANMLRRNGVAVQTC